LGPYELGHEQEKNKKVVDEAATKVAHDAVTPLKRSFPSTRGTSADASPLKRSKVEGRKLCTAVKLTPLVFAYPRGRILLPNRALDPAIDSLSLPKEGGPACLSSFLDGAESKDVRVVVKVPQEVAEGMVEYGSAKLQLPDATGSAATGGEGAPGAGTASGSAAATDGVAAISPGTAIAAAAAGGDLAVTPGTAIAAAAAGGDLAVTPGTAIAAAAAGGDLAVTPGTAIAAAAAGGDLAVTPGTAIAAAASGGDLAVTPGTAIAAAAAGSISAKGLGMAIPAAAAGNRSAVTPGTAISAAAGVVTGHTAGPSAADPLPAPVAGAAAAGAAGALLCPGCQMVAVHEFNAVLCSRLWDGRLRLARLTSHMRPFLTWRLFAVEAVVAGRGCLDVSSTCVLVTDHIGWFLI
jgi:hypothetical protein